MDWLDKLKEKLGGDYSQKGNVFGVQEKNSSSGIDEPMDFDTSQMANFIVAKQNVLDNFKAVSEGHGEVLCDDESHGHGDLKPPPKHMWQRAATTLACMFVMTGGKHVGIGQKALFETIKRNNLENI